MIKRLMVAVPVAIALALSACAPFVSTSGEGAIQIYFGTPAGARALSDPPFTELPVFSGITIKVSGPGMDPVEFTVDASQTSFTAMVPGGSNRTVELYAPVDWDATATAYPDNISLMPTLVKAYGATTTLNVVPGQRVTAVLRLEVAETKILLPDASYSQVAAVDSMDDSVPVPSTFSESSYQIYLTSNTDFDFDRHGFLYFSTGGYIYQLSALEPDQSMPVLSVAGNEVIHNIAADRKMDRIYYIYNYIYYLDLSNSNETQLNLMGGYYTDGAPLAVDESGNLYCLVTITHNDHYLAKIRLDGSSAIVIKSVALASLGLDPTYPVQDMQVVGDRLYIAEPIHDSGYHGKVVEVSTTDLSKRKEIGGSETTPSSQNSLAFFGPTRFLAVNNKKLYLSDEGFNYNESETYGNLDRIVEVDIDSGTIERVGYINEPGVGNFNYYC